LNNLQRGVIMDKKDRDNLKAMDTESTGKNDASNSEAYSFPNEETCSAEFSEGCKTVED
jgi:hypothetical protein